MTTRDISVKRRVSRAAGRRLIGEILVMLLFLLFMVPFFLEVLNSAKTSAEIINSPVAWPGNWQQMVTTVSTIFTHPIVRYPNAFFNSLIITVLSLAVIAFFLRHGGLGAGAYQSRWSTAIFLMFVSAMVIPFQVMFLLVQWFRIMETPWDHCPFWAPTTASSLPTWALAAP